MEIPSHYCEDQRNDGKDEVEVEEGCRPHFDGLVNEEELEHKRWASRAWRDVQLGFGINDEDDDMVGSDDLHY